MERKSEEFPLLVAQTGPLNGQRWPIRETTIIGREPSCDIIISDRQVSRQHVRITLDPDGVMIEDLGSKNGTHINGQSVLTATWLQDGDIVQIALAQQFVFLSSDATIPLEVDDSFSAARLTGLLRVEKRSRRVWIGDQEVLSPLSVSQFKLLETLYENAGRVVSRSDLIRSVWGDDSAIIVSEQALDALVRRLRDRLAELDAQHTFVATVRGHGLRLDNPPAGDQ